MLKAIVFPFAKNFLEKFPFLQGSSHKLYKFILNTKNSVLLPLAKNNLFLPKSLSDRGQDSWVIEIFEGKRSGFFLEAGAADGFSESNTYVLEKRYGWRGICIEPNSIFFERLLNLGRSCICESTLIDSEDRSVDFAFSGQESGIISFDTDNGQEIRKEHINTLRRRGSVRKMSAKPLADILYANGAPEVIDYFSFDVEGAETRILRSFPFNRYRFLSMTIERPTSELNELLFSNGYVFVKNVLYDTFYIHKSHPNFHKITKKPFEQLPQKII